MQAFLIVAIIAAIALFLCVIDEKSQWTAADVAPNGGYFWRKGEWHHVGGGWDGQRGLIKLFFDGEEISDLFQLWC